MTPDPKELRELAIGLRVHAWTIVFVVFDKSRKRWGCRCNCGNIKLVAHDNLARGNSKSCGCGEPPRHGRRGTPTYKSWMAMRQRCLIPKSTAYESYGGKGISVCNRWRHFVNFLADMGERPPGTSLDRIDNKGNYEPGNCRWATRAEQSRNRSDNRAITIGGQTLCLADWASRSGLSDSTIRSRIKRGWEGEKLLLPAAAPCINKRGRFCAPLPEPPEGEAR